MRVALASPRLAQHDPWAATSVLAPVLNGSIPQIREVFMMTAALLDAVARDALGDQAAAGRSLKRVGFRPARPPAHPVPDRSRAGANHSTM
jgi:LuxR family maltose regulon positive regulatory protein